MASHPLRSCHSWPSQNSLATASNPQRIDHDPFSHFVSLPMDRDLSLPPGTCPSRPTILRSHSLSPDLQKARRFLIQHGPASSPTFKLKRWIQRMEQRYRHREVDLSPEIIEISPRRLHQVEGLVSPDQGEAPDSPSEVGEISQPISPPLRGRKEVRSGSRRRAGGRRPRAWRAPSGDLWTVNEEGEVGDAGLGIFGVGRSYQ